MGMSGNHDDRVQELSRVFNGKESGSKEIVGLYDWWSQHYDQDVSTWGYHLDKHLDEFEDFEKVDKSSRILDVAAGTGMVGQKLKERGYTNIDALDGSEGMLERAKVKDVYRKYIHAFLGPHPVEGVQPDTYDALICACGLSPKHVTQDCFESLATITKPGGHIYFLTDLRWMEESREGVEERIRQMESEGWWRWELVKESGIPFYEQDMALVYAMRVL